LMSLVKGPSSLKIVSAVKLSTYMRPGGPHTFSGTTNLMVPEFDTLYEGF